MQDLNQLSQPLIPTEPPENGSRYTFIAGLVGGSVLAINNIAIVLVNAEAFRQVSQAAGTNNPAASNVAGFVGGLQCLVLIIGAVICFFAGFFVGKKTIQRRLGFYAGALVGFLLFLSNTITNFIPSYPTHLASGGPTSGAGLTIGVMFLILIAALFSVVAGLTSLLGAWIATSKHPYYRKALQE